MAVCAGNTRQLHRKTSLASGLVKGRAMMSIRRECLRSVVFIAALVLSCSLPVRASAQTPLTCGQAVTGSITVPGERDTYSFPATAGDAVTLRVIRTSGSFIPDLELYDATRRRLNYTNNGGPYPSNGVGIDTTLTAGGTYTVVVYDHGNTQTGSYNRTWQRLNGPCEATAVVRGQTVS